MADQDFEPRAAARLIEQRRKNKDLSVRSAAAVAGISEGRWRQIAKGYQQAAAGVRVPVNTPDTRLARMARAVGVAADELEAIGEGGVANEVRSLDIGRPRTSEPAPPLFGGSYSDPGYLQNLEGWLLELQTRVEALEGELGSSEARTREPKESSNGDGGSSRGSRVAELRESGRALGVVCRVDRPVSRPDVTVVTPGRQDGGSSQRVTLTDSETAAASSYDDAPSAPDGSSYTDEAGES